MYNSGDSEVQQYKQALGAYKKINSLLSFESIFEKEEMSHITHDEHNQSHQTDTDLIACLDHIPKTDISLHKACKIFLGDKNSKYESEKKLEERERALNAKEKELYEKEKQLLNKEKEIRALDAQFSIREAQVRELVGKLTKAKQRMQCQLEIESLETISYLPQVERVYNEESEASFSKENLEIIMRRIAELEESNAALAERNAYLEEEVIATCSDINEQKYLLVKEREKLVTKENSLKCREQTLLNRENRLIENTKYINTTVKSVNQYIKSQEDCGQKRLDYEDQNEQFENKGDHLTFRVFLQSLGEIKDISNLPDKENRIRREAN